MNVSYISIFAVDICWGVYVKASNVGFDIHCCVMRIAMQEKQMCSFGYWLFRHYYLYYRRDCQTLEDMGLAEQSVITFSQLNLSFVAYV